MGGGRTVGGPETNPGQDGPEIGRRAPDGVGVGSVGKMDTTLLSPDEIAQRGGLR